MIKNLFKNYIYPISVFSGGVIGVGFLSLPYVAMQSGIWITLGYFIILTALIVLINLIFCDISLKTPDFKRFPGFVGHYFGKKAEIFTMILIIVGAIGVLLAYLLVGSQFLESVFKPVLGGSTFLYVLIYFFIVSIIVYFDIKVVSKVEFWVLVLLFLSLLVVFIEGFSNIKLSNIFSNNQNIGIDNLFLPYGPLLFALWGVGLIPEVEEMIRGNKKRLKSIITASTIIISVFYFLFVILILGITGNQTDQIALIGLKNFLNSNLVSIALLMGALAAIVAFITQGIILKKTLVFDLKIKHWQAFIITCCPPLVLFLIGFTSFIPLLSFIGAVLIGIDGILILLMYKKIGGKNIIIYSLSLLFLLGVIYELMYSCLPAGRL
ncbi:MAG: aromatic amino acid transport family protein [Candidatus Staskawiczbacteria bacterium]|jgi:amino acid permease